MDDNSTSTNSTNKVLSFLSLTYKEMSESSLEEPFGGWLISVFVLVTGITFVAVVLRHSQIRNRGEFLLMAAFVGGGGVLATLAQLYVGSLLPAENGGESPLFSCLFTLHFLPFTFALLFEVFALFALVTDRFLSMRYLPTYPLCAGKYAVCLLWCCVIVSVTLLAVFLVREDSWGRQVSAVCSPSSSWESPTHFSIYLVRSVVIIAAVALSIASLTYGMDDGDMVEGKNNAADLACMYAVQRRLTVTVALLCLSSVLLSLLPPLLASTIQGDWLLSVKYYGAFISALNSINCTFTVLLCFLRHSILCNGFLYFFEPQKFALILKTCPY